MSKAKWLKEAFNGRDLLIQQKVSDFYRLLDSNILFLIRTRKIVIKPSLKKTTVFTALRFSLQRD